VVHPIAHGARTTRRLILAVVASAVGVTGVAGGAVLHGTRAHRSALTTAERTAAPSGATAVAASRSADTSGVSRSTEARPTLALASVKVAPLHRLIDPDVVVTLPRPATAAALRALAHAPGVLAATALDLGTVRTPLGALRVAGVDPSAFRSFTPKLSAVSDPLWQSVARDEVTIAFSRSQPYRKRLGTALPMASTRTTPLRLGAFATLGIPGLDAVVSHDAARRLHLTPRVQVLVAAPRMALSDLRRLVTDKLGQTSSVQLLRPQAFDQSLVSQYAAAAIPASYLRLYRSAATTCRGLPWTVLAAIGAVETGHGADTRVSSAGAMGPMQFMPETWAVYGVDANGDGKANILDPVDAVYSAARYLCASGAGRGGQALYDAIFAYNHADWYVREVIALALRYE
jgi:hypothetical protein